MWSIIFPRHPLLVFPGMPKKGTVYTYFTSLKQQRTIGFLNYALQVLQVMLHIIFATGVVYLLKVKNSIV